MNLATRIEKLERTKPPALPMRIHLHIVEPTDNGPKIVGAMCDRSGQSIDRSDDETETAFIARAEKELP